jgi:hypothetical protein
LLFDLGALDPSAGGAGSDGPSGDAAPAPEAGEDDAFDDVAVGAVGATDATDATDEPNGIGLADASADVADGFALRTDAADATAEMRGSDASRDASADAVHDTAPPFDAASCASVLLTPSTTVVASSTRTMNYPSQATDKLFTTRWESTQQADEPTGTNLPPQWIDLDFGVPVSITRVRIDWQSACASLYQLQVSDDASSWVTLTNGNVTNGSMNGSLGAPTDWSTDVDTTGLSGVGRYLRVNGTERCLPLYGYSIWEMEVYGHGVSGCAQGM